MIVYDVIENKLALYFDEKQINHLKIYQTQDCNPIIKKLFSHCKTQNQTRLFFCFENEILIKIVLPPEDLFKIAYFFVYNNANQKPECSYYRNSIKNINDYNIYHQLNKKLAKYSRQNYFSIKLIDLLKEYRNYQQSKPSVIQYLFEFNLKSATRLKNHNLSKYKFYPVCRDIYLRFCKSMKIKRIKLSNIKDPEIRFNAKLFSKGLLNNTDLEQYRKICEVRKLVSKYQLQSGLTHNL